MLQQHRKPSTYETVEWTIPQIKSCFAAYNPRLISHAQLNILSEGIQEFSFLLPVVINERTMTMVSGHQRVKAAEIAGLPSLPVHLVNLSTTEEQRLNLALNKISGKWDHELLETAIQNLETESMLQFSGFSQEETEMVFDGSYDTLDDDVFQAAAALPEETTVAPPETPSPFTEPEFVDFHSPKVRFRCTVSSYEDLTKHLLRNFGQNEIEASKEFFRIIGINDVLLNP